VEKIRKRHLLKKTKNNLNIHLKQIITAIFLIIDSFEEYKYIIISKNSRFNKSHIYG
jgi:hypothetical protein